MQKAWKRFDSVDAVKEPLDMGIFAQLVAELLANNRKKEDLYRLGETLFSQTKAEAAAKAEFIGDCIGLCRHCIDALCPIDA